MRSRRFDNPVTFMPSSSIGWALFAFALSLPWLMPVHTLPWTGFHADALMALVVIAALAVALLKTRGRWTFPISSVVIVGVSFIPLLQYLFGMIYFPADAFLASTYLLAFGFAVLLGRRMEEYWPGCLAPAVFASFGIAAGISVAIALNQWLQLEQWSSFTIGIGAGSRPVANVAQPNKLATLYVWGLAAFGWAFRSGVVRGWLTVVSALLLLFGIAMTQSRMGALAVSLVMVMAILRPRVLGEHAQRWVLLGLFVCFLGCVFGWSALTAPLEVLQQPELHERLKPGTRILHWRLIMDAILQRPFWGWGWQQVSVAQSTLALQHPISGEVITFSHNLVLDLLAWNGIPLGVLLIGGIAAWFVEHWRSVHNVTGIVGMLILSVFLLHSMLELPHASLTFLLPAGLLVGTMSVYHLPVVKQSAWFGCRETLVALVLLAMALCFLVVVRDYLRIEAAWMDERMRAARIGDLTPVPIRNTPILGHLSGVLILGRTEPRKGMTPEQIEVTKRLTYRFPGVGSMLKLAQAQMLNGQSVEAGATLDRLCRVHPKSTCDRARKAWAVMMDGAGK